MGVSQAPSLEHTPMASFHPQDDVTRPGATLLSSTHWLCRLTKHWAIMWFHTYEAMVSGGLLYIHILQWPENEICLLYSTHLLETARRGGLSSGRVFTHPSVAPSSGAALSPGAETMTCATSSPHLPPPHPVDQILALEVSTLSWFLLVCWLSDLVFANHRICPGTWVPGRDLDFWKTPDPWKALNRAGLGKHFRPWGPEAK